MLVTPEPAPFAAAIRRLLDDSALREQLGRAAAERARTRYSRDSYVSRTRTAFERLAAAGAPPVQTTSRA
jgi:glycosyltransferase involved in cell wall biosynthesis